MLAQQVLDNMYSWKHDMGSGDVLSQYRHTPVAVLSSSSSIRSTHCYSLVGTDGNSCQQQALLTAASHPCSYEVCRGMNVRALLVHICGAEQQTCGTLMRIKTEACLYCVVLVIHRCQWSMIWCMVTELV